jgi:predicted flap endonuclease-1-like 5' DNA nuclease
MNWSWFSFIVGILVGWIIEWVIDWVFWRRKHRQQQLEIERLQQELDAAEAGKQDLQRGLDAAEADKQDLQRGLDAAEADKQNLEQKAVQCNQALEAARADLAACRADLEAAQVAAQEAGTRAGEAPISLDLEQEEGAEVGERVEPTEFSPEQAERAEQAADADVVTRAGPAVVIPLGDEEEPERQDLTKIEGIGPKIAGVLNEAGIINYWQLADTPVSKLQSLLGAAGPAYRTADPSTWPEQARLADENKWDELQALQDRMSGGHADKQDLTKIEGIGPKIAGLLQDAGILNYALLADAPVERLREVLAAAGSRYRIADPTTWPRQARLAAEDKWDELQALQDRFKGGREVDGRAEE